MSADSVPSSKTNIFQSKLYTLIYCRHFRTYSRCTMFNCSDTVFRRRNVTRRRISNTVLQPRYWGREADSPEVCRLTCIFCLATSCVDLNSLRNIRYPPEWIGVNVPVVFRMKIKISKSRLSLLISGIICLNLLKNKIFQIKIWSLVSENTWKI
jgi:hypothetical protein